MSDNIELTLPETEALSLTEVAIALDTARQNGNARELAIALDRNLELWVAIKTQASRPGSPIPAPVAANLSRLADFIAGTTLQAGTKMVDEAVNTLININFQISEGLLEGNRQKN